jgi:hypothetical protein
MRSTLFPYMANKPIRKDFEKYMTNSSNFGSTSVSTKVTVEMCTR